MGFRQPLRKLAPASILSALLVLVGTALWPPPVAAQAAEEQAGEPAGADSELSPQERKQLAKEERIAEYLRKKEEKRALREQQREERVLQEAAREVEDRQLDEGALTTTSRPEPRPRPSRSSLPRDLARAQENVRRTALGDDPTVQTYLDLIDRQMASPHELAAFGNFVAQNGMTKDALEYYEVAVRLEPADPTLWINFGTLHRQDGNLQGATSAYSRALSVDPNSAFAHYNLAAVMEATGRYEDAVEGYKTALSLDPTLGDPVHNPQAANNRLLIAVKLMLFREQAGSLGLPLVEIPVGEAAEPEE